MFHSNRTTRISRASVTTVVCAALVTTGATAANVTLQTIAVTPAAKTISVGQKQSFAATGTFSNGSRQVLGPDIANVAPGGSDTCALLSSGGVECWGWNYYGQLGDGTTTDSLIPRPVKGISTATAAASKEDHSCALLANGAVKCWGYNAYGQLGNGSAGTSKNVPVSVTGVSTATAVATAYVHSCAVLASGAVQCWGSNEDGRLGDGSLGGESHIPVSVKGISTATALALGVEHSCALLASGAVKCWGDNDYGQLGYGSRPDSSIPVSVTGVSTATAVATGYFHSCAVLASGAVKCWGLNNFGQLGNGTSGYEHYSATPVTVTGISTAVGITAGHRYTCAVLRGGSVKCWGYNGNGELGDGTFASSNIPVLVRAITSPTRLMAGDRHTCALFSGGMMRCWGWNSSGQLGNRRYTDSNLPVPVVGTPGVVWKSTNTTKATITDRGVATGRAVGNTTITATTAGFINDNAVLTVK